MATRSRARRRDWLAIPLAFLSLTLAATTPATNTPVPPLQWIELTSLLSGPAPPGLKYASIGFDSTSSILLIFGGESNGFPEQKTYLLDVDALTWMTPNPPVSLMDVVPPARSLAISGDDFAASNRHGHVIIGGKGQNNQPLGDAWEFDYISQFWSEISMSPGGPSARFGAAGGTDLTAAPSTDPNVPGPNNTFYLAGGSDGNSVEPLSDLWKFEIAGVLSSNNPKNVIGSWTKLPLNGQLPSRVREASAVMPSASIAMSGGCAPNMNDDDSCALQDSFVINLDASNTISPSGCPAPRVGPVMVPNYNSFSQSFATQALMMVGLFNESEWDDGNGLKNGEVDIFDFTNGVWTRLLPSGDPSAGDGSVKFPVPREGAVAYSSPTALFGNNGSLASDIIMFGGQDANGTYLNDVWLLRSYHAALSSTNATWTGFGDGKLDAGIHASGSGVTVQYLTTCASEKQSSSSSASSASATPSTPSSTSGAIPSATKVQFDTSTGHKILSPVSLAIVLVAVLAWRSSAPSVSYQDHRNSLVWLSGVLGLTAYATGIAGLALAFSTLADRMSTTITKRSTSSSSVLQTGHGKAALSLFLILYGLLLVWTIARFYHSKEDHAAGKASRPEPIHRKDSDETRFSMLATPAKEKRFNIARAANSSPDLSTSANNAESPPAHQRSRTLSLFNGPLFSSLRSKEPADRPSLDSAGHESSASAAQAQPRSFEVINRGNRVRRLSANGLNGYSAESGHSAQPSVARSLSELDWLDRRQNVAAFSELDYALSRFNHQRGNSVFVGDSGPLLSLPKVAKKPILPSRLDAALHLLLHVALLGLCAVTLAELFQRAPKATFIVFLLWVAVFYCIMVYMSWHGIPKVSILSVVLGSLKHREKEEAMDLTEAQSRASSRPLSAATNELLAPNNSRSPYTYHQPAFRRALSPHETDILSSNGHQSDDDDVDEDTRQRRIEGEMERREVSIITVPKRKLWITNPS